MTARQRTFWDTLVWQDAAACADPGIDPDLFYSPEIPETPSARRMRVTAARQVCARCPVAAQCLTDALEAEDGWAIRAGLTPAQRGRRRRADIAAA